jgi:hypothetical protein
MWQSEKTTVAAVVREDLSEEVTFVLSTEWPEEASGANPGDSVPDRGKSDHKGL